MSSKIPCDGVIIPNVGSIVDSNGTALVTSAMQSALNGLSTINGTSLTAGGDIVVGVDLSTYYAITTDPGVAGSPWNSNGFLKFSTGYSPSVDFSNALNSMYIPLIFQDI